MPVKKADFKYCDELVEQFLAVIEKPVKGKSEVYYTGVDLGTACVVIAVLNDKKQPVAGAYTYADVVKDGMVVDYIGAVDIVRKLKEQVEKALDTELEFAAAAIPPGTNELDFGAVKNVVQGAGFTLTNLLDESTAANAVLQMQNGAVVDIGGGTTGISVFKDGEVAYVADEPTGGTHFSLVVAGAYGKSLEDAELFKRQEKNHEELMPVVMPVIEKVSTIISGHIKGRKIQNISLVGGTACFEGIENVIEQQTGIKTHKPKNPMFVTPLGIALNCLQAND